jgi:large subunit ribosomal protein L10Ae
LNKNKRKVRKLEHRYDAFLASEKIIRQIPRLLGPGLGKARKFPMLLTHNERLSDKIQQVKSTLRVQLKKQANINVAIGHIQMTIDELMANLSISINFIIGLLRKKWENIGKIYIKSTMGKCHRLY